MRRAITVTCAAAAVVIGGSSVSTAAPPERQVIDLECDNGQSFAVEVNGNGSFTPGRIVGSTGVLVPTAFGPFSFLAVSPTGEVLADETDPTVEAKGGGSTGREPTVQCTFTETIVLEEPEEGFEAGTIVTFSGTVTGFITGRR